MYNYGARYYDPAAARFTSVDRFASKFSFQSSYVYAANNPITFIDVNGDSIGYANQNIQQYVENFSSPTRTNSKGKVKKNRSYNAEFAGLVDRLRSDDQMFIFSDDAALLGGEEGLLGLFGRDEGGSHFNIVAPSFSSNGDKGPLSIIAGGRAAILAEETKHATQYLEGDLMLATGVRGLVGLKPREGMDRIQVEAEAKIWVANSGMARLSTDKYREGYRIPTYMGVIRAANSTQSVRRILLTGHQILKGPEFGSGKVSTFNYPPTYSPF